jgi:excisionase family DNA binding protein
MNANELKFIRGALKPYIDSGLLAESAMNEISDMRGAEGKTTLITRKEACSMLQVTVQTLINWQKSGQLKPIKLAGKTLVRYRRQDVEALFQ